MWRLIFQVIEYTHSMLDSPTSLEAYLVKEGRIHARSQGIQKQYLDFIGPLLYSAIAPYIRVRKECQKDLNKVKNHFSP